MEHKRNMPGLPPNLPQHHPVNPPPGVLSQSNLSAAAAAASAGSPRASGAYHPSSVGGLHAGANCASPSGAAALNPNFHGFGNAFQPAMLNVANAGTSAVSTGGISPHVNQVGPGISQTMGHPVYFGAPPRGSMTYARPPVSQRTPPNMLPPASAPFGVRRATPDGAYPPLVPRPTAIDPLGNSVGDAAPQGRSTSDAISSRVVAGGFGRYSNAGGAFVQERMHERVQEPRITPHRKELLSRPLTTRPSSEAPLQKSVAETPTEVVAGAPEEAKAGSGTGSSLTPMGSESREKVNEISSTRKPSSTVLMEDKSAKLVEGENQEPPLPTARKRPICTLLPPGYLSRCRGTVNKRTASGSSSSSGTSTRGQSPVVEGPKGALHVSLNSDSERGSTDILDGWLLTEDQALGDISLMREHLPPGVVISSRSRSRSEIESEQKKHEDASPDPVLITSEEERLKIAREEGKEDEQGKQDKDEAVKNRREEAEGKTSKAAAAAVDASGAMSSGKSDKGSSSEVSAPAVEKDSDSKNADAGAVSEVVNNEGGKVEGGLKGMKGEDKGKEPAAAAVPTQRELMDWDEKRDALELKELMILERTREMRRSFAKERANADAVIQFLSQREREDKERSELLRMKRTFLLDLSKTLKERASESDELSEQMRSLTSIKPSEVDRGTSGQTPPQSSPTENPPPTSKPLNKRKGKEKCQGASAVEAMELDEDEDAFETDRANSAVGGGEGQGQAGGARGPGEGGGTASASSEALVGDEDHADVYSVAAHAMMKCWDALTERLAAARKVVREVGVDTEEDIVGAVPAGRNGGKGKSRRANATDADELGEGGQSSSSADESDVSGTVRIHGGRSRKRKLARNVGVAGVPAGSLVRKRGRRRQGSGGSGAIQEGVERERLDWPSTIIPRTPYNIPLLLSCLSTYPDKVVAALHPAPRPGPGLHLPSKDGGETHASNFAVDMLQGFTREEKLRQAHLEDRAVFEQVESVTQMYEEASKMLEQPRANSPKLKGAFKSERHEVEREMWRQELEDLQEAVAKAMPPPSPEDCKDAAKAKSKLRGKRGAAGVARVQSMESPPAASASASASRSPCKGGPASSAPTETTPVTSSTITSPATCSPRSVTRAAKPASSETSINNSAPAGAKGGRDMASTAEHVGARKGRPARGTAKTPNPAVGRRTSTRGSEAKARA